MEFSTFESQTIILRRNQVDERRNNHDDKSNKSNGALNPLTEVRGSGAVPLQHRT